MGMQKKFYSLYSKITGVFLGVVLSIVILAIAVAWQLQSAWEEVSEEVKRSAAVSDAAREALSAGIVGLTAAEQALSISEADGLANFESHITTFEETGATFRLLIKALAWGHDSTAFKGDSHGATYQEWRRRGWETRFVLEDIPRRIRELAGVAEIYWSGYVRHAENALINHKAHLTTLAADSIYSLGGGHVAHDELERAKHFQRLTADTLAQLIGVVNEETKGGSAKMDRAGDLVTTILVFALPILVLLPAFAGWLLVTKGVLRPLEKLSTTVASIGQREICDVLYLERNDELGDLARNIDRMQRDLQQTTVSKDYFDNVIKSIQDCLFVLTPDLTIQMINPAVSILLGYDEDALMGESYSVVFVDTDALYQAQDGDEFANTGILANARAALRTKDGREVSVWLRASALIGASGDPEAIVCVAHDMTERDKLENQLMQVQKLESVGQLAAGIAHEINTPIQYVRDNTLFLQTQFENLVKLVELYQGSILDEDRVPEEVRDNIEETSKTIRLDFLLKQIPLAIEQTLEGAESVVDIVRSMKDFSHPGTKEKTLVDVNKAIQSTVTVSRNEWKYVADMELDLDDSLPTISGYIGELNQVFLNLIINAAHAISDATDSGSVGKGVIRVSTKCIGDRIEVRIGDTGTGIPEDIQPHVFNPFFTTKDVGKGTGQGLAIAYNTVVEKHHGSLSFETEPQHGTTFVVGLDASM